MSLQVGKVKAVGEGVKGGFSRASSSWANSNGIWLASLDGWRVWFSCSRACDNRSVFDSSVFSSLTFEWKRWKTGRALLTRGTCFLPQIDQDGLTLPERTLYLAQDEESEKVPRQRLGFWEGKSLRRRVAGGGVGVSLPITSSCSGVDLGRIQGVHGASTQTTGSRCGGAEGAGDPSAGTEAGQCEQEGLGASRTRTKAGEHMSGLGLSGLHSRSLCQNMMISVVMSAPCTTK